MASKSRSAAELNKELYKKVDAIKVNDASAIFGTTSQEDLLVMLKSKIIELSEAIIKSQPYDKVMDCYEQVVSNLDTAAVTGLISESEMAEYYKIVDDIWAAIEQENNLPS